MSEPPIPHAFEWRREPWGLALRCRPLAETAPHLFTTRHLPLEWPDPRAGEGDGWRRLAASLNVAAAHIVRLRQVHGARVVVIPDDAGVAAADGAWTEADGAVTRLAGEVLSVRVADCVPLLVADRRCGTVAAVHAGWRGTAAGVAAEAVHAMRSRLGTDPADLVAAVGPSLGPCCCQVGPDVREAFLAGGFDAQAQQAWFADEPAAPLEAGRGLGEAARAAGAEQRAGKWWLDTWQANIDQLTAAGVPPDQIHASRLCSACYPEIFDSYRCAGAGAGRMVGAIRGRAGNRR